MLRFKISDYQSLSITENNTNAVTKRVCILKTLQRSPDSLEIQRQTGLRRLSGTSVIIAITDSKPDLQPADREDAERDEREMCRRWLLSGAVNRDGYLPEVLSGVS